ncbi:LptF/LptG family permease [Litorimonas sp. WD9-15]|uniref:LptF/LptG family permease n=1 Tax=Litorimonas sp. WD9-15 TaxID=3418716 RepID=UPI003D00F180
MTGATLSRYIAGRTLRGIGLAFLIVTAIITLVDFVEGSRNIGADVDVGLFDLLGLTFLKVPKLIEQTIPFVVLFGVMGALFGMNRRSELIVMRASGLSAWRFLRPALIVSAVLGILWATVGNPVASDLMSRYETRSTELTGGASAQEIWLREGSDSAQRIIQAKVLAGKRLDGATFYEMTVEADGTTSFARRYDADQAELRTPGYWTLTKVIENAPGEETQRLETITLPTAIGPEELAEQTGRKSDPPFWKIRSEIAANKKAGFSARALHLQLNKLLALPFLLVAMTFIAAGVSMSLTRQGGTLRLLVTGAVMGFAVFFADSVMSAFGEVAILPVTLAAWAVPALVLLLGITYLARIEDG